MSNKKVSKIITVICLLALGAVLILKSIGYDVPIFFKGWWTLFIIIPGLMQFFGVYRGERAGGVFLLILGIGLLLQQQGILLTHATTWLFIVGGWLVMAAFYIFYFDVLFPERKKYRNKKERIKAEKRAEAKSSESASSESSSSDDDDW